VTLADVSTIRSDGSTVIRADAAIRRDGASAADDDASAGDDDAAVAGRDAAAGRRDAAMIGRDAAIVRDAAIAPDAAIASDAAIVSRDAAMASDAAIASRDAAAVILDSGTRPRRGPAPVLLGSSSSLSSPGAYALLAKTGITNATGTRISGGHLGVTPAASTSMTGFGLILDSSGTFSTSPSVVPPARVYGAEYTVPTPDNLRLAVLGLEAAYTDGSSRPNPDFLDLSGGNIGGLTLVPGLYKWNSTVTIPSTVTIAGGANDTWIFQITNDVDLTAATNIILSGGAQADNIFWLVAGQVTIHENAHFEGIIISQTAITMQTTASFHGRALAQSLIALDDNAITAP